MNGIRSEYNRHGFVIVNNVFTADEVSTIAGVIDNAERSGNSFRQTKELFAVRKVLNEIPALQDLVFNSKLRSLIGQTFGEGYFPVKSIYFDKPGGSNWFVAYHQDLTISVKEKIAVEGFGPWTLKHEHYAVQPPLNILENNFTVRIHLDDTDENNGALRVIPSSHTKGIYRPETIDWNVETETSCHVKKGGVMIMSPLLLHASSKSTNENRRRVIHIEFSNQQLPSPLQWSEQLFN